MAWSPLHSCKYPFSQLYGSNRIHKRLQIGQKLQLMLISNINMRKNVNSAAAGTRWARLSIWDPADPLGFSYTTVPIIYREWCKNNTRNIQWVLLMREVKWSNWFELKRSLQNHKYPLCLRVESRKARQNSLPWYNCKRLYAVPLSLQWV